MTTRRLIPSLLFIPARSRLWMRAAAAAAVDQAAAALCRARWQPVPVQIARPVRLAPRLR